MIGAAFHEALALAAASPLLAGLLAFALTLLTRLLPGPIALVAMRLAAVADRRAVRSFVSGAALAEVAVVSLAATGSGWIAPLLAGDFRLRAGALGAAAAAVVLASLATRGPCAVEPRPRGTAWRWVWRAGAGVAVALALPSTWAWWAACAVAAVEARLPLAACWLGAAAGLIAWAALLDAGAARLAGLAGALVQRFVPDHGAVGDLDPAGAAAGLVDGPELVE